MNTLGNSRKFVWPVFNLASVKTNVVRTLFDYRGFQYSVRLCNLWVGYLHRFAFWHGIVNSNSRRSLFNYFINKKYVFKSKTERAFIAFVAAYAVVYAVTYVGIFFLKSFGNSSYIAALIMLPLSAMLSFFLNKKVVFRNAKTN